MDTKIAEIYPSAIFNIPARNSDFILFMDVILFRIIYNVVL